MYPFVVNPFLRLKQLLEKEKTMSTLSDLETAIITEYHVLENNAVVVLENVNFLFSKDVWPYVKAGILSLLTVAGKAAIQAELAAIPLEIRGDLATAAMAVGAAITSAVNTNAGAILQDEGAKANAAIDADPDTTETEKAGFDALISTAGVVLPPTTGSDLPHPAA
jgi:hypothetical protein